MTNAGVKIDWDEYYSVALKYPGFTSVLILKDDVRSLRDDPVSTKLAGECDVSDTGKEAYLVHGDEASPLMQEFQCKNRQAPLPPCVD